MVATYKIEGIDLLSWIKLKDPEDVGFTVSADIFAEPKERSELLKFLLTELISVVFGGYTYWLTGIFTSLDIKDDFIQTF